MNLKTHILIAVFAIGITRVTAAEVVPSNQSATNPAVEALGALLSSKSAADISTLVGEMESAAATRRFDAANLIIDALRYNYDPLASNESRSQEDLIPAIGILKRYYGEAVCPLLMFKAVTTEDEYLRERCALAVKVIASSTSIKRYRKAFSLDCTEDLGGRHLRELLDREPLKVHIESPMQNTIERLDKAVDHLKMKSQAR